MKRAEYEKAKKRAIEFFDKAKIAITEKEKGSIEVVDFTLGDYENMGLEILVYVNTEKVCAKELVLFPRQTCAEHIHPTVDGVPGKEETFRCRYGTVYLYVAGEPTPNIKAKIPKISEGQMTVFHEIILNAGEQYTLMPDTLHWFQAGDEGAVVSEFSTTNTDELDIFTDKRIQRFTQIED